MSYRAGTCYAVAALALAALLAGCAAVDKGPGSYVVLLRDPDGNLGNVVVKNPQGEQVLSQAFRGVALDGNSPPYFVTQDQLQRDFGAALAARPQLPETFVLYMLTGGTELTPESNALLPVILQKARERTAVDISVTGHTDSTGPPAGNERIARERAEAIADQLRKLGLQDATLTVESHGQHNQAVKTANNVNEPKNRRVEVILR